MTPSPPTNPQHVVTDVWTLSSIRNVFPQHFPVLNMNRFYLLICKSESIHLNSPSNCISGILCISSISSHALWWIKHIKYKHVYLLFSSLYVSQEEPIIFKIALSFVANVQGSPPLDWLAPPEVALADTLWLTRHHLTHLLKLLFTARLLQVCRKCGSGLQKYFCWNGSD